MTLEIKVQGYIAQTKCSFIFKKNNSSAHLQMSQLGKAATSEAGLSIQQEPSRSNKGTYSESVYRDFIQF